MVSSIDTILAICSSSIVIGRIVGKSSASFSQSGRRERTIEFAGWRVTLSRCVVRFCFILVVKGWRDILGHWTTQRRIDSVAKRSPLSTTNYFFLAITLRRCARLRVWNTLRGAQCRNAGPGPAIEQLNLISVMDSDRNANYSAGTSDFELLARIPRYLLR